MKLTISDRNEEFSNKLEAEPSIKCISSSEQATFMFFYLLTLVTAFLLLTSTGLSAGASISAALACINNLGPALFELGPSANYGILSDIQLSILSVVMLLGRLELLTIFVFFSTKFKTFLVPNTPTS